MNDYEGIILAEGHIDLETGEIHEGPVPASGSASFAALCQKLIEDEGFHWLHPIVKRFRSTDWIAEIHSFPLDDERTEKLASGQRMTMEDACAACVQNFHERARICARKAELLKDPKVQEALKLFNVQNGALNSEAKEG